MNELQSNNLLHLKDPYGLDLDDDETKLLCYECIKKWSEVHINKWNSYRLFSNIPIMVKEIIVRFLQEGDEFMMSENCKQITNNGKSFYDIGSLRIPKIHSKCYRGVEYQWHFNVHGDCSIGLSSRSRLMKPRSFSHPNPGIAFIDIVDNVSSIIVMKLTIVKSGGKQSVIIEFIKDGVRIKIAELNKSLGIVSSKKCTKYWNMCIEGYKQHNDRTITLQTFLKKKIN